MKRRFWCDISEVGADDLDAHVGALRNQQVDVVVARPEQEQALAQLPARLAIAYVRSPDGPPVPASAHYVVVDDLAEARRVRAAGGRAVLRVAVTDARSMNTAGAALHEVDALVVTLVDETNIPLELLLAEAQATGTEVVKSVRGVEDALVAMGVLEAGVGGILVPTRRVEDLGRLAGALAAADISTLELAAVEVTSSRHVGMGYRGCIDTVTLFEEDEGMLVGSTSGGGILVCAEVHYLPYMNLRPFRVNAGAVHSYVWAPGNRTEYVTDLAAGVPVLAVNTAGRARPVTVGRVKIEVRPLRLIEGRVDGQEVNLFLQDDWHVRVMDAEGKPVNCTDVVPGTRLLGYACDPGRHVGIKVQETIEER